MNAIEKLLSIASNEVGYLEKKNGNSLYNKTANAGSANYTKYGYEMNKLYPATMDYPAAWCDCFVDWCFVQAFGKETAMRILHKFDDYTVNSAGYYKNNKEWYTTPKIGDQIFFKNANGGICHTGIVYKVDNTYVYTIEGNTSSVSGVVANGGAVEKKKYARSYNRIAGYGRPNYSLVKENKKMLETGNDIIWELMNGKYKLEILEVDKAVKALDKAKNMPEVASLYWILYKLVNGNG